MVDGGILPSIFSTLRVLRARVCVTLREIQTEGELNFRLQNFPAVSHWPRKGVSNINHSWRTGEFDRRPSRCRLLLLLQSCGGFVTNAKKVRKFSTQ